MPEKKKLTIGITVNLDNYENLRLEVEGEVENQQDADGLIAFLDSMLARLGRGDAATAQRMDAYRRRVFGTVAGQPEPGAGAPAPAEAPCPTPETIEQAIPPAPEHPHPPGISGPQEQPEPTSEAPQEQEPAAQTAPKPTGGIERRSPEQPGTKQGAAPPAEGGGACENCGATVTKSQAKLSQLFMGRTLCKRCMEQP